MLPSHSDDSKCNFTRSFRFEYKLYNYIFRVLFYTDPRVCFSASPSFINNLETFSVLELGLAAHRNSCVALASDFGISFS